MDNDVRLLLIACIPFAANLFLNWLQRRKDKASAYLAEEQAKLVITQRADQQVDTSLTLMKTLQERVKELEAKDANNELRIAQLEMKVDETNMEVVRLTKGINRLVRQIKDLDQIPVWTP